MIVDITDYCGSESRLDIEILQSLKSFLQEDRWLLLLGVLHDPRMLKCLNSSHPFILVFVHQTNNKILSLAGETLESWVLSLDKAFLDSFHSLFCIISSIGLTISHKSTESPIDDLDFIPIIDFPDKYVLWFQVSMCYFLWMCIIHGSKDLSQNEHSLQFSQFLLSR